MFEASIRVDTFRQEELVHKSGEKFFVEFGLPKEVHVEVERAANAVSSVVGHHAIDPRVWRGIPITRPFTFTKDGPHELAGHIQSRIDQGWLQSQLVKRSMIVNAEATICARVEGLDELAEAFYGEEDLQKFAELEDFAFSFGLWLPVVMMLDPSAIQSANSVVENSLGLRSPFELSELTIWQQNPDIDAPTNWVRFETFELPDPASKAA